jgi:hypothetical protein
MVRFATSQRLHHSTGRASPRVEPAGARWQARTSSPTRQRRRIQSEGCAAVPWRLASADEGPYRSRCDHPRPSRQGDPVVAPGLAPSAGEISPMPGGLLGRPGCGMNAPRGRCVRGRSRRRRGPVSPVCEAARPDPTGPDRTRAPAEPGSVRGVRG